MSFEPKIDFCAHPDCLAATDGAAWAALKSEWLAVHASTHARREVREPRYGLQPRLGDMEATIDVNARVREALGSDDDAMMDLFRTYVMNWRAEVVGHEGRHIGFTDISQASAQAQAELVLNRLRLEARFKKEEARRKEGSRQCREILAAFAAKNAA